jgi:1-deoxy-D-xylulose-5-phosphate synthase
VAVVEDNSRAAGVGSAVALALGDAEVDVPVRRFGIPEQFLAHAKRGEVLADIGLTPVDIAGRISGSLAVRRQAEAARAGAGAVAAQAGAVLEEAVAVPVPADGSQGEN